MLFDGSFILWYFCKSCKVCKEEYMNERKIKLNDEKLFKEHDKQIIIHLNLSI